MTKEEFVGWKSLRVTEEIYNLWKKNREDVQERLNNICFSSEKPEDMVRAARYAGILRGLDLILDLTYEELA